MKDTADQALDQLAGLRPEPPPLSAALETELGALRPVAPRHPVRQLVTLAGVSLIYGAGLLAMYAVRPDLGELPRSYVVGAAALWLLGFFVPCYLALVPRPGTMTARWKWAAASAAIASVGFIAFGMVLHPRGGPHSVPAGWIAVTHGYGCLELGLAAAIVPVVVGAIFLRGALPVGSRAVAAALGAGGGALGGLFLHLHCQVTGWQHLALMHGGVVLVAALLAAALVPRGTDRALR